MIARRGDPRLPEHGILGADEDSGSLLLEYIEVYDCGERHDRPLIYMATDEVTHPGVRVPHAATATCTTRTAATTSESRAERNEIYYNWIEGALYHELELIGPDPAGGNGWPGVARGLRRGRQRAAQDATRSSSSASAATARASRRAATASSTTPSSRGPASARCSGCSTRSRASRCTTTSSSAGGGAVNLLREVEALGRGPRGRRRRNWVTSGLANIPPEWTNTISGTDPGFAQAAILDLRPAATAPIRNAGPSYPESCRTLLSIAAVPAEPDAAAAGHSLAPGAAVARPADGRLGRGRLRIRDPLGDEPARRGHHKRGSLAATLRRISVRSARRGLVLRFRLSEPADSPGQCGEGAGA